MQGASDAAGEVPRPGGRPSSPAHPRTCSRRVSEQRLDGVDSYSIRQPVGVVAGITPFNFPAMVPMWISRCHRGRQRVILKPSEKDRRPRRCCWPRCGPRPGLPDGCSTWCRRPGSRSTRSCSTRASRPVSFVGSTPIARTSTRTDQGGPRVQASAAPRTTWWWLPTRTRLGRRRGGSAGFGSPGSAAWRFPRWSRSTRRDELVARIKDGFPGCGWSRHGRAFGDGPLVTGPHRTRSRLPG